MLKPLNNRVVLKPDDVKQLPTSFDFIIPDSAKEKATTGVVVVGSGVVSKGDKVIFSKFGFDEVVVDKKTLYLVPESNLLAIVE